MKNYLRNQIHEKYRQDIEVKQKMKMKEELERKLEEQYVMIQDLEALLP